MLWYHVRTEARKRRTLRENIVSLIHTNGCLNSGSKCSQENRKSNYTITSSNRLRFILIDICTKFTRPWRYLQDPKNTSCFLSFQVIRFSPTDEMMLISRTENFELNPTFEPGMGIWQFILGKITPKAFLLCRFPCPI